MVPYRSKPVRQFRVGDTEVASFVANLNADDATVRSFGDEWNRFASFSDEELQRAGDEYFDIVTPEMLNKESEVLDIGCGTGRWSKYVSARAKFIEAVDPGDAVLAAVPFTKPCGNIRVTQAGYGNLPFAETSFDFVFSLGVVHHVPDTAAAVKEAASMVKPRGWLLLYIYYSLDNRGVLYRLLFGMSNGFRRIISSFPRGLKTVVCEAIAVVVYLPFVLLARLLRLFGGQAWRQVPLSYYADKPWRVIRNDALDRFGTPLEKRFSRKEIAALLEAAGMSQITFSENQPYWHVAARK